MSFPHSLDAATLRGLIARRELYAYKTGTTKPPIPIKPPPDHLTPSAYQLFVRNFFNPATPYRRLHLLWSTGAGKTTGALIPAMEFIRAYKPMFAAAIMNRGAGRMAREAIAAASRRTPTVFVLGFDNTKEAFARDLLKYPYFGFVSAAERDELARRKTNAASRNVADQQAYNEYHTMLKSRISRKMRGGFFEFLGYDEFVNRLFYSETTTLAKIEIIAQQRIKENQDADLESVLAEYIASGEISVNEELIASMQNSLLICDEIHETYNSIMRNNRGVAIQYVLDRIPSLRFISLSATPISNSPTESVDFVNYFTDDRIFKSEIFASRTELRPGAVERLGRAMFGKISVVQDIDLRYFPRRTMCGDSMVIQHSIAGFNAGDVYPYIKFTKCEATELQLAAMRQTYGSTKYDTPIPVDGNTIYDMVYPAPNGAVFRTSEVADMLQNSPAEWRRKIGIVERKIGDTTVIGGSFLRRENIAAYSTKLAALYDLIISAYSKGPQKMMIYHSRVKSSGTLQIQEFLRENGILDETSTPAPNTLCVVCAQEMHTHGELSKHAFIPMRSLIIHSRLERSTLRTVRDRFNDPSNITGLNYAILIGSKIIKQGFDFKGIRTVAIMSAPASLYEFIQIIGRAVRKESHAELDEALRNVNIWVMLMTMGDEMSIEFYRYVMKAADHLVSQRIVREWSRGAVDANINRAVNMSDDMMKRYFPDGGDVPAPILENWYYDPAVDIGALRSVDLSDATYYAHGRIYDEVEAIVLLVKYAFTVQIAWTYDALFEWVRNPPVMSNYEPALFTKDAFAMAILYLTRQQRTVIKAAQATAAASIYDFSSKFIYVNDTRCAIVPVGKYYVAIPVSTVDTQDVTMTNEPVLDAETYIRLPPARRGLRLTLADLSGVEDVLLTQAKTLLSPSNVRGFLTAISVEHQIKIVVEIIEGVSTGVPHTAEIIELLRGLGALITMKQVRTYAEINEIFGPSRRDDDAIVGYGDHKVLKLYNGKRWITVKRIAMNRKIDWRENPHIVGLLESSRAITVLKLRNSIDTIRATTSTLKKGRARASHRRLETDTRSVERGMTCETRSKVQLDEIANSLNMSPPPRIRQKCHQILDRLVELETSERAKKSRIKYLYGWWDDPVDVISML